MAASLTCPQVDSLPVQRKTDGLPERSAICGATVGRVRIRTVEVCPDCRLHWTIGEEPPKCLDPRHARRRVEVHQHQDTVVLSDGTPITAVSFAAGAPYERDRVPDFGLYLDPRWRPPWPHTHLEWPDFGVPDAAVRVSLQTTLSRARAGQRVEVGCLGAHGRTGTAMACLAILTGVPAARAVDWVRTAYCSEAVETPEQVKFVSDFANDGTETTDR